MINLERDLVKLKAALENGPGGERSAIEEVLYVHCLFRRGAVLLNQVEQGYKNLSSLTAVGSDGAWCRWCMFFVLRTTHPVLFGVITRVAAEGAAR